MSKPNKGVKRICITLPITVHKALLKLRAESLNTKGVSSFIVESVIEKYGKKVQ